jgi:hypothetical protein
LKYLVTVATTVDVAIAAVIAIVAATTVVTKVANGRAAWVVVAAKVTQDSL